MADGPGKYDLDAETMLKALRARVVCLVVVDGHRGHGVALKLARNPREPLEKSAERMLFMAQVLRDVADNAERDAARLLAGDCQFHRSIYGSGKG